MAFRRDHSHERSGVRPGEQPLGGPRGLSCAGAGGGPEEGDLERCRGHGGGKEAGGESKEVGGRA